MNKAIESATTIAQAKLDTPNSLWDFLLALPATQEAQMFYALLIGGAVGMCIHYLHGRAVGDIAGSPVDYFFRVNVWRSVAAMFAVVAELFSEAGIGIFISDAGEFVGWGVVLMSGIKTGYVGDSLVNKGQRAEWTDKKRDAVEAIKESEDKKLKP